MLRIFAGIYKGRKLKSADTPDVRPTTAKVKLSFFDIVQEEVRESVFLDGFGGSGNIGIEALSRGAEYVVFIDILPESIKLLKDNIERIGIPSDHYRIIKGDYNRSIIQLSREGFKFDIIFLDPPYKLLEYANPVKVLFKRDVLADDGIIVLEKPSGMKFEAKYFDLYREHRIGQRTLNFYRHEEKALEFPPV